MGTKLLGCVALFIMQTACIVCVHADDYAPASLTAVRLFQNADKARGSLAPGTYVVTEREEGGGLETISTTYLRGDDYIEYRQIGPFVTASGSIGGHAWQQNTNGIVSMVDGFRTHADPNLLAWQNPGNPKYNVRLLGLTRDTPPLYVVEANPPGGSDQFRYFDARTFLLVKQVTYAKDRLRHVVTYDDYRTVRGETRWFRWTYSDGRPQNDLSDTIVSFDPQSDEVAAQAVRIPPSRKLFDVGASPLTVPARFTSDGVVVRINIAGRGLDVLLDSGASEILLDPGVAHQLGIAPYGRRTTTIGGDFDTSLARVPEITVGPIQMHDVAITLGPVHDQLQDTRVVGLLGFDFLANAIDCLDFGKSTLTLYSQDAFRALRAQYQAEPAMLDDEVPRVPAFIQDVPGWFLLDTGATASIVYRQYLAKVKSGRTDSPVSGISAVGGSVAAWPYLVSDFAFGPVTFANAEVLVPQQSTFDLPDYDGIIGRDLLSSYQICLDYADDRVYLK